MRTILRVVMIAAVVTAASANATARAALADDEGESGGHATVIGGRSVEARAFDWTSVRTGTSRSAGAAPRCRYVAIPHHEFASYFDLAVRTVVPFGARFYRVTCDRGATWSYGWWVPARPTSVNGAFQDVIQEAIDRLTPPRPAIVLSPPAEVRHVVGIPTWLAVTQSSWATLTMSVTAGDVRVDVRLRPVETRWWIGDGAAYRCPGPGPQIDARRRAADQSTDCWHTFTQVNRSSRQHRSGRWPVGVEIAYDAAAVVTTPFGSSSSDLRVVLGPPAAVEVAVDEVQAVRTVR